MSKIFITYKNYDPIVLQIDDTPLGDKYVQLLKDNYQASPPVYRDRIKYNSEYLLDLAQQAKAAFGWDWELTTDFTLLHKDLEMLLGTTGFEHVSAEYDNLLTEIHYCLHIVQHLDTINSRDGAFQIEWFNDLGFTLDQSFEFNTHKKFGDVEFINPFVGHGPVQIFYEDDHTNITQTCKFHNFVKPGIVISTYNQMANCALILDYFKKHDPAFVNTHTEETILHYTGYPKIGHVVNLNDFKTLLNDPLVIELERIDFE